MRRARLTWLVLVPMLAVLLGAGAVQAAAAPRTARPADPYAVNIQDEVMMQNLTCDDILTFKNKDLTRLMVDVAGAVLDEPQHVKETSDTLFGPTLTRLILAASNYPRANHPPNFTPPTTPLGDDVAWPSGTTCNIIVPISAPPNASACDAPPLDGPPPSLWPVPPHPGELKLLGMFDHAAKYKNCRR